MVYVDREGRIVLVNEQTGRLFGYSQGELEGKEIEVLIPERFRERHRKQRAAYELSPVDRPIGAGLDLYGLTKGGREFPVDISLSPIETSGGLFVLADIRDISDRKRAEEEIRRGYYFQTTISSILRISLEHLPLEEQMERILDTILLLPFLSPLSMGCIYLVEDDPSVLVMKVQRGLPQSVKSACARVSFGECLCGMSASSREVVFGASERHAREFDDVASHGHYCVPITSGDAVLGVMNLYVEKEHQRSRQEEELLSSVAKTLAGTIERRKAEQDRERLRERLNQAEKLSALGRFTANVAHEIRNPLTALGGFARRLEKKLSLGTGEKRYVGIIISEVARLERILRSVLTFSREAGLNPRPEDMNAIIEESLASFELLCRERSIRIDRSYGAVPHAMVDRDRIREVLQNLLSNAVDAMPQGGVLAVISKAEIVHGTPLLSVRITDTGKGIPEDKLRLIFEPFFTTKVLEQGTGLGLAISKKIVEDHGGAMGVESTVGKGSTFIFSLPIRKIDSYEVREGVIAGSGRKGD
jgi:PAS domain S-box-containing protein